MNIRLLFPRLVFLTCSAIFCCAIVLAETDNSQRWIDFLKSVSKDLRSRSDPETQREAIRKFASEDYREAVEYLINLTASRRTLPSVKLEASEVLKGYRSAEASALIDTAVKESRGGNKYLLSAYIAHGTPESRSFLLGLVKNAESPAAQALAIDAVTALPSETVSPGYAQALIDWMTNEEAFHGIRIAATKALGQIPQRAAVPALISQLSDPLLMGDARDSLLRLTGEQHWMDDMAWTKWWQQAEGNYEFKIMDDPAFEKLHKEMVAKFGDGNSMNAEFYGRKLEGKNILFILDNSGSMLFEDRIVRLKSELEAMINNLDERYKIGLLVFPKSNVPGRDFDQATEKYKEKMLDFVSDMTPNGGTPMVEALEHALRRIVPRNNIDTIYLLSDGIPTDLKDDSLSDVVLRWNDGYRVKFNTIYISEEVEGAGDDMGRKLMETVAKDNRGTFYTSK